MLYPPALCSEHVTGNCCLLCVEQLRVSILYPVTAPCLEILCLSVCVCVRWRRPAGVEDIAGEF